PKWATSPARAGDRTHAWIASVSATGSGPPGSQGGSANGSVTAADYRNHGTVRQPDLLHQVDKPIVRVMDALGTQSPELVKCAADLRVAVGRIARRVRQAHEVGELTLSEVSVLARLD